MTTQQAPRDIHALIEGGQLRKPVLQLDQETKEEWGREGTPLIVESGAYGDDEKNGPFYEYGAIAGDQPISFRIYSNAAREMFHPGLVSLLADGPVSGLRLRTYDGKGGNARVELEPV